VTGRQYPKRSEARRKEKGGKKGGEVRKRMNDAGNQQKVVSKK